jgi:hypothetical protein
LSWALIKISQNLSSADNDFKFSNSLFTYSDYGLSIRTGGNPKTCLSYLDNQTNSGFLILGVLIDKNIGILNLSDIENWKHKLDNFHPQNFDGHFIIIKWNQNNIHIFSDILGLRDIYLYRNSSEIILATNPLHLKNYTELKIDFNTFGSRWLLFNQISTDSVFQNIERISSGNSLQIDRHTLEIKKKKYDFNPSYNSDFINEDFEATLKNIIELPLSQNNKLSLSLSGGLDSRLLLSYLLNNKSSDWSVHTFGAINNPDRIIAEQIISTFNIKNEIISNVLPDKDELIKEIEEYSSFTMASYPSSDIIQLLNYKPLQGKFEVIIDGGFGEIWRRQFLNRLYFFGKNEIQNKNFSEIIRHLTLPKADIFNNDTQKEFHSGTIRQLEEITNQLPDPSEIGLANWLDLFSIKTRLPNLYAQEQIRLDHSIINFMPFAQLSLLNYLFTLNINKRKNSRLIKKLIKSNNYRLTKIPLTKNDVIYPFDTSSLILAVILKINKKTKKLDIDETKNQFFKTLSEFSGDLINSKNVKEYYAYDYKKISLIYNNYIKNPDIFHAQLDWFLAFEFFRQALNNKSKTQTV